MRGRTRRGSTVVEGALVITVVLLMIFGVIDFGRLMFTYNSLAYATQQAARYAAVHGSSSKTPADSTRIDAIVKATLVGTPPADLSTTVNWSPNTDPGALVTVRVSCTFRPLLNFLTLIANPLVLRSSSALTVTN